MSKLFNPVQPMKKRRSFRFIDAVMLGAVNGLLVGLALEQARIAYFNYQMSLAAREYNSSEWAVDFVDAHWEPLIPLVCTVIFGLVSYLVQKYLVTRPRVLPLLWVGLAGIAVGAGYFMSTSNPDLSSFFQIAALCAISALFYRLWRNRPNSLSLLWATKGVSAVVLAAMGTQLVGLFFYWKALRSPMLWLVCLLLVVAINLIYGALLQYIFGRFGLKIYSHWR